MRWTLILFLCACAPPEVKVGKVNLIEADGVVEAAPGPLLEVPGSPIPPSLQGPVQVAIDRNVPLPAALTAIAAVRAAGGTPVILVIRGRTIAALPEWKNERQPSSILLEARTDGRGCKPGQELCVWACLYAPDNDKGPCGARPDGLHIDRAFVRQAVGKAVKTWGISDIHVTIDPKLTWADAIRAVDGARTCCGDTKVRVSVAPGM